MNTRTARNLKTESRMLKTALRVVAVGWCGLCALLFGAVTALSNDLETVLVCGTAMAIATVAGCSVAVAE